MDGIPRVLTGAIMGEDDDDGGEVKKEQTDFVDRPK